MKLYNSLGPNPRLVRMFLAEKGVEIPTEEVDIMAGANRKPPYTDKNPAGQLPALELDDGDVIAETVAICEYVEEKHPKPALIGETPEERAKTRMWVDRVTLSITEPLANGFRFAEGLDLFKDRLHVIPQAADDLKATARENLAKLDQWMNGRDYITGDRPRLPDIILYALLDFGRTVGQPFDTSLKNVSAWFERMEKRESATKSIHHGAERTGLRG